MTEAVQKRHEDPVAVMLMIVVKYQPGSRKEKEALLQQIQNPDVCWKEEKAFSTLKMWKRRVERARELKVTVPDPCILLSALDGITFNAISKDTRRMFRINSARDAIGVDVNTSEVEVNQITLLFEGELEESVTATWTTVGPKIKSVKGNPKGDKGKDGNGANGDKGKGGKDGKGKDRSKERCYFFTETEDGCNKG